MKLLSKGAYERTRHFSNTRSYRSRYIPPKIKSFTEAGYYVEEHHFDWCDCGICFPIKGIFVNGHRTVEYLVKVPKKALKLLKSIDPKDIDLEAVNIPREVA